MNSWVSILLSAVWLGFSSAVAAFAGDPFKDPVKTDVLPGWIREDGSRIAALRLTLEPGWKTYWRAPGDTGIPPLFDWSESRNLADIQISWPTPQVFEQNGLRSIGYSKEVVIPFVITPRKPGRPVRLRADMELGVCADVCMPHRLSFDAVLKDTGTRPTPAIAAALADAPYSEEEAGVRNSVCILRPSEDGIEIEAHVTLPRTGKREFAVIEPGIPGVWVSEAQTRRSGDTFVAISEMVNVTGRPFSVDRSEVRITVLGGKYAVDVQGCEAG